MEKFKSEESQFKFMYEQYLQWKASQEGQQDAYEFERSFEVFCQQMNKQMLELATQEKGSVGKKKSTLSLNLQGKSGQKVKPHCGDGLLSVLLRTLRGSDILARRAFFFGCTKSQ